MTKAVQIESPITHPMQNAVKEVYIQSMCSLINTNKLLSIQQSNRGVSNIFTGQLATLEQAHDTLSFCQTELQAFKHYITTRIPHKSSSTNAPLRCHKLMTMSTVKKGKNEEPLKNSKQSK